MKDIFKSILAVVLAEFVIACIWRVRGDVTLFFVHLAGLSIFFAGGNFSMIFVKRKFNKLVDSVSKDTGIKFNKWE
jgi:hypothetical protein